MKTEVKEGDQHKVKFSHRKKTLLARITTFTKEKVNSKVKIKKNDTLAISEPAISISSPQLEHTSLPTYENGADYISECGIDQNRAFIPNESKRNHYETLDQVGKDIDTPLVRKALENNTPLVDDLELRKFDSSTHDMEFLPKVSKTKPFITSLQHGFISGEINNQSESSFLGIASLNSIENLQKEFDDRTLNVNKSRLPDSYYSIQLGDSVAQNMLSQEEVRVYNLDESFVDDKPSEDSLMTTNTSLSHHMSGSNSAIDDLMKYSCPSGDLISDDEFVFDDTSEILKSKWGHSNSTQTKVANQTSNSTEKEPEKLKSILLNNLRRSLTNTSLQSFKTVPICENTETFSNANVNTISPATTAVICNKTRTLNGAESKNRHSESRGMPSWRKIITGLPRILPINYKGRDAKLH